MAPGQYLSAENASDSLSKTDESMKLVKAIIRPNRLADVLRALYAEEIEGLTVSQVRGHGGEEEMVETYRGTTVKKELHDKVMLDIGVTEPFVERTVTAIRGAAMTGRVGDGKIFVLPVERVVRVRTGEEDSAAVTPVK